MPLIAQLSRVLDKTAKAWREGRLGLSPARWLQQLGDLLSEDAPDEARAEARAAEPSSPGLPEVRVQAQIAGENGTAGACSGKRFGPRRNTILVSSHCQTAGLAASLKLMLHDHEIVAIPVAEEKDVEGTHRLREAIATADVWVTSGCFDLARRASRPDLRSIKIPELDFRAYHPDIVYAWRKSNGEMISKEQYNSSLLLWAWDHGLSARAAAELFCEEIYRELGFMDAWPAEIAQLRARFAATDIEFSPFFLRVKRLGNFMHSINHPKLPALRQIAAQAAALIDPACTFLDDPALETIPDVLLHSVWPVYPEIAACYSLPGSYVWKFPERYYYGVDDFVAHVYEMYRSEGIARGDIRYAWHCGKHFFATLAKKTGSAA